MDLLQFDAAVDRMRRVKNRIMREYLIVTATAAQGTQKGIEKLAATYTEKGEPVPGLLTEADFLRDFGSKGF